MEDPVSVLILASSGAGKTRDRGQSDKS